MVGPEGHFHSGLPAGCWWLARGPRLLHRPPPKPLHPFRAASGVSHFTPHYAPVSRSALFPQNANPRSGGQGAVAEMGCHMGVTHSKHGLNHGCFSRSSCTVGPRTGFPSLAAPSTEARGLREPPRPSQQEGMREAFSVGHVQSTHHGHLYPNGQNMVHSPTGAGGRH